MKTHYMVNIPPLNDIKGLFVDGNGLIRPIFAEPESKWVANFCLGQILISPTQPYMAVNQMG